MTMTRKGMWRLLAIAAVAVLLQMQAASTVAEGSYLGRDLALCVQACNAASDACKVACGVDCLALYPNRDRDYNKCYDACVKGCGVDEQDCKAKCNLNKTPVTPDCP